jgi:phosphoserine phosphatase
MLGVRPHTSRKGRTERRVGAFFDVDKTILSENSGTLYLKALYDRGEVDWQTLLANLGSYVQYKLNLLDLDRWTKRTMQQFKGRSERALVRDANSTRSAVTWSPSSPERPSSCSARSPTTCASST